MKRMLFLVLIVAGVVGLGVYRGWFNFSSGGHDNNPNITLTVHRDKIEEDKGKVVEKLQDLGQQTKDKVAATTQKAQN